MSKERDNMEQQFRREILDLENQIYDLETFYLENTRESVHKLTMAGKSSQRIRQLSQRQSTPQSNRQETKNIKYWAPVLSHLYQIEDQWSNRRNLTGRFQSR